MRSVFLLSIIIENLYSLFSYNLITHKLIVQTLYNKFVNNSKNYIKSRNTKPKPNHMHQLASSGHLVHPI